MDTTGWFFLLATNANVSYMSPVGQAVAYADVASAVKRHPGCLSSPSTCMPTKLQRDTLLAFKIVKGGAQFEFFPSAKIMAV